MLTSKQSGLDCGFGLGALFEIGFILGFVICAAHFQVIEFETVPSRNVGRLFEINISCWSSGMVDVWSLVRSDKRANELLELKHMFLYLQHLYIDRDYLYRIGWWWHLFNGLMVKWISNQVFLQYFSRFSINCFNTKNFELFYRFVCLTFWLSENDLKTFKCNMNELTRDYWRFFFNSTQNC